MIYNTGDLVQICTSDGIEVGLVVTHYDDGDVLCIFDGYEQLVESYWLELVCK